jgi:UDP-N-acetylglucosamine--N-acetylmuramyl-(pentapeptide) pyrophosphoryl-undecaprenol N-acetylglucosamine transferase
MSVPPNSVFAVITGGGTSGHVLPALAIAELLNESGHPFDSLHYVGSSRGIETTLLPTTAIASTFLRVDGLQRSLSVRAIIRNVKAPFVLAAARREARRLLQRLRPSVVVSVGGYASVPACSAARSLGIPVVVVSYDRMPGLASRVQSRYCAASAVAYIPSSLRNAQLSGAPVRASIRHCVRHEQREDALVKLGFRSTDRVVLAMGGSLGSQLINQMISSLEQHFENDNEIAILHIAGARNMNNDASPESSYRADGSSRYKRVAYCDDMAGAYSAATVVVCRAGASTIAEIATVGIAAVIIPWKDAADNHQLTNAQWLTDVGAAVLLDEVSLTAANFIDVVGGLVGNHSSITEYESKSFALGEVHRNCTIATIVESVA